ncbi:hypothetical protein E4S40_04560 [Algoriphagus kandeliae]|uniref:Uncharacterized protein n=1 Tax=Algoriphagus kandeliae TaxID=2562278 RepID=A0A4Y9QUY5_9BACT|nr:hypothetical protein [Algoriphagus kandeliae]TFV95498.1 hypothetical protein E4S40_04560 [Algoriphagus kandeliae]
MGKKKSSKPKVSQETDWDYSDFSENMGIFPADVPFGRNIGCGGKRHKKENQTSENQKNKN